MRDERLGWLLRTGWVVILVLLAGCQDRIPVKRLSRRPESGNIPPVRGRRVLVVHSYHEGYSWVQEINEGLADAFDGRDVEQETFYMDTKRRTSDSWKRQAGRWAMVAVDRFQPDVIIAVDDNAQEYFARQLVDSDKPVVFCGVNQDPAKYGYPARNVTGITERPDWDMAMQWVEQDFPGARIGLLSSDDPTSLGAYSFMKQIQIPQTNVIWRLEDTWSGWQRAVHEMSDEVEVLVMYVYHTIRESEHPDSPRVDPRKVLEWTLNNTDLPTMGFLDSAMKDGVLMGVIESGHEHGFKSGDYARRILDGAQPSQLPVICAHQGICKFNRKTAERLNCPLINQWIERGVEEVDSL
jgi:ABC-type uncharacterized transport system substrate-binding protein